MIEVLGYHWRKEAAWTRDDYTDINKTNLIWQYLKATQNYRTKKN